MEGTSQPSGHKSARYLARHSRFEEVRCLASTEGWRRSQQTMPSLLRVVNFSLGTHCDDAWTFPTQFWSKNCRVLIVPTLLLLVGLYGGGQELRVYDTTDLAGRDETHRLSDSRSAFSS